MNRTPPFMRPLALLLAPLAVFAADQPNIILILADDLGARDLGCFGSKFHETPNLDRLAARGVRLTNAYAASPLCSPTRASILTGQHPARIGITAPACHLPKVELTKRLVIGPDRVHLANSVTRLKPGYFTLAESLKAAGYATAHFGKWHLGHDLAPTDAYEPRDQGFDFDWPHVPRAAGPGGGYLAPWKFITDPAIKDEAGRHIDERMADEAGKFIRANKGRPFFLNFWLFSVHSPWNARPDYVARFKPKADPADPQHNPLYAAMVKSLDDAVGRLLKHLEDAGEAERTVIVFWSDNGGWAYPPKATDPEGYGDMPATSNLPFRSGKASLYEGGTREPGIVVWPGKVKAGSTADFLMQSTDLYPTLIRVAGAECKAGQKLDGFDQSEALTGGASPRRRVFCHFPHGNAAKDAVMDGFYAGSYVREGDLKLIRFYARAEDGSDELELYDLAMDPGEKHNLAQARPQVASELNDLLQAYLLDNDAILPRFNPAFAKPAAATPKAPEAKPAADPLQGWKNRGCAATTKDGVLTARGENATPFLGVSAPLSAAAKLKFRLRCAPGGKGAIDLIPKADSPAEQTTRVNFEARSGDWQEIEVDLPAGRPTSILRLYLPSATEPVELDWVELLPKGGKPRRWDF